MHACSVFFWGIFMYPPKQAVQFVLQELYPDVLEHVYVHTLHTCMYIHICRCVCISYSGVLVIYGSYSCEAEGVARGQATV